MNTTMQLAVLDEMMNKIAMGKASVREVMSEGPRYDTITFQPIGGQPIQRRVAGRSGGSVTFTVDLH